MADCIDCGAKIGFLNRGDFGRCSNCSIAHSEKYGAEIAEKRKRDFEVKAALEAALVAQIEAVILTTETAPNLNITKRIEIVTAEVAYGMNIFKDLFAGVRDIVGGRSEAVQKTMRDARRTALYELKKEAHSVGANAVVGVDLDYVELSGSSNMVMLVASGTAVVIEDAGQ
jgi:uncharacterized protein YbjQ (UPF0145 family)